jgi:hypothetical protein
MRSQRFPALVVIVCALLIAVASPAPATDMMGWYFPLLLGASWTYENVDNPLDTFTETVFELIEYEGQPAWRFGTDIDNHSIVYRQGGIVTVYAEVDEGELIDLDENIVLAEVVDGSLFRVCFDSPCDSSLIRVWANLDPALRSIYGMDPAWTDMLLFASYDPDYPPNLHNVVVESNLPDGAAVPTGAVTGLQWYLRGVGWVVDWDVDAESGGLGVHYELVSVSAVDDAPSAAGGLTLEGVAPNPFNPHATIRFRLAAAADVTLIIHDLAGRRVRILAEKEPRSAGSHAVVWDGTDARGRTLPSGTYFCRIATGDEAAQAKLILLR